MDILSLHVYFGVCFGQWNVSAWDTGRGFKCAYVVCLGFVFLLFTMNIYQEVSGARGTCGAYLNSAQSQPEAEHGQLTYRLMSDKNKTFYVKPLYITWPPFLLPGSHSPVRYLCRRFCFTLFFLRNPS